VKLVYACDKVIVRNVFVVTAVDNVLSKVAGCLGYDVLVTSSNPVRPTNFNKKNGVINE
jgi:hypothetical protein